MRYCTRCVMPDTKPDLRFDEEGVCSACRAYDRRVTVDWKARGAEFLRLVAQHKTHPVYDCVVGSSGGKDSHAITIKARELGLRPLVVTASTDHLTDLGRRNLENLKEVGVDCVEFTPKPTVRRKLNRIALEEVGDIEWPEHCAIFGLPIRIAHQFGIAIVLYGENSQDEYGGPEAAQQAVRLDKRWREEFGGLLGLRPKDLIGRDGIEAADLWPYEYPDVEDVFGVFLGQFFPWDGWQNALVAQAHGFELYPRLVEGSLSSYENLDNAIVGIHDYFKWLKFGFGRASDIASLHIRRGRLARGDAVNMVQRLEGRFPWSYLGVSLGAILGEIGMDLAAFREVVDRFANPKLLKKSEDGEWRLREPIS